MRKQWWQFRKTLGNLSRKMILWCKYLYFKVTPESLKRTPYNELPAPLNLRNVAHGRDIIVEIGSGHGEVLLANDPAKSISIGYEIKTRFYKLTYRKIRKRDDIFVFQGSGYESTLLHYFDNSIARLLILFPDPWHKRKHNKRRPITAEYLLAVAQKMKNGGRVIIATDWLDYVEFIAKQVELVKRTYTVEQKPYDPSEFGLPITHFHQKWIRRSRIFNVFVLTRK